MFSIPSSPPDVARAFEAAELYFQKRVQKRMQERMRSCFRVRASAAAWRNLPRNLAIHKLVNFYPLFTLQAIGLAAGLSKQRVQQIDRDVEKLRVTCPWTDQALDAYGKILEKEGAQSQ
jgi:hypothetical protein